MRILFADQFSEMGGAQTCLEELLDEVVRRGWQAQVMAPGNGPLHGECARRGVRSFSLPLSRYANGHKTYTDFFRFGSDSLRAGLAMRRAAHGLGADVIYVNGPRALPAAVVATLGEDTPIVFHAHSYSDHEYTQRIVRWCVSRKRMTVVAISRFAARPFAALEKSRLRLIYNGVRDHGFLLRPQSGPQCIGIIGRISPEKGHLDFVRAAGMMSAARPNLRFLIFGAAMFAGDAYEREVRKAAQNFPVQFCGWTNNVSQALHDIDILAVPSGPAEGATRVIMEAFSAGTPVVAYPSGGIPELIRHRETGLLAREGRAEDLAAALAELLNDPELARRLSLQARQEWEGRFQLDRWRREICDLLKAPGRNDSIAMHCGPEARASADDARRAAL